MDFNDEIHRHLNDKSTSLLLVLLFIDSLEGFEFMINRLGAIQCLRRQEEVGRWSKRCSFLSKFRVKIVYIEVGRWSKKD